TAPTPPRRIPTSCSSSTPTPRRRSAWSGTITTSCAARPTDGSSPIAASSRKTPSPAGVVPRRPDPRRCRVPRIDLGRFGAVISPATEGFVDQAVELDRLGFSTIWLTGGQMSHLGQVSEVVQATQSARIATGIISVDRFSAADVAELYAELEGVAPGRF